MLSLVKQVADASNPSNVLRDQTFDITIADDNADAVLHPVMVPGTKLGLTVKYYHAHGLVASNIEFYQKLKLLPMN